MPRATNTPTTPRRSFLRFVGAAPALTLPAFLGVQAMPTEARAAPPTAGADAELLALYAEYHRQHDVAYAAKNEPASRESHTGSGGG